MTPPDANERWTQRILGGLGVRPVGHQDPNGGDPSKAAPPPPAAPPAAAPAAPTVPAQRGNRLPPWWEKKKPVDDEGPQVPIEAADDPAEDDEDQGDDTAPQQGEAPMPEPAPTGPVEKVDVDSKGRTQRKTSVRQSAEKAADDPRMRILFFNGTAAAVGKSLGLVDMVEVYLPVAEQAATGVFGLVLAVGGAWGAWKILGHDAVQRILPGAQLGRVLGAAAAAELARRLAPVPVAYANAYGQEYGLGPSAISLLLTAGGICGALWWVIDRPMRSQHWVVRWAFRIPLASALLAAIPYGTGPVF